MYLFNILLTYTLFLFLSHVSQFCFFFLANSSQLYMCVVLFVLCLGLSAREFRKQRIYFKNKKKKWKLLFFKAFCNVAHHFSTFPISFVAFQLQALYTIYITYCVSYRIVSFLVSYMYENRKKNINFYIIKSTNKNKANAIDKNKNNNEKKEKHK